MQSSGIPITSNQRPDIDNRTSRFARNLISNLMPPGFVASGDRPLGISVYMRVKDEKDWIAVSVASIRGIADEIVIVDNGSSDGTYEILQELAAKEKDIIKLSRKPELHHCDLSNFALQQTSFRWVFRWDGDMVAHTDGRHSIINLRERIFALDPRRYYLIYLRHINLSGDLFHQDVKEMVHIEEYVHIFSDSVRFVQPGRFEALKFPLYYKPLFWYEPYVFHVNVKPGRRMLLRYFWEEWMQRRDYDNYPHLEDYVAARIEKEFGTSSMAEAEKLCVNKAIQNHIPFDSKCFGPYPAMLRPLLEKIPYRIQYQNGRISGRTESGDETKT